MFALLFLSCSSVVSSFSKHLDSVDILDAPFFLEEDIAPPIITSVPYSGMFYQNISVSFQSNEFSTKIYYTLDGSEPTLLSSLWQEGDPSIFVSENNRILQYFGIDDFGNQTDTYITGYQFIYSNGSAILDISPLFKSPFLVSEDSEIMYEWFFSGNYSDGHDLFLNQESLRFYQVDNLSKKSIWTIIQGEWCFASWNQVSLYFNSDEYLVLQIYKDEQAPHTQINISTVDWDTKLIRLFNFEKSTIWYKLENEEQFNLYLKPFKIHNSSIIKFYAVDLAGNKEVIKRYRIFFEKEELKNNLIQLTPLENSFFQNLSLSFEWEHFYQKSDNIQILLQISLDVNFENIFLERNVTAINTLSVTFQEQQRYYYRFRIFKLSGIETLSQVRTFCVGCVRYDINQDGFSDFLVSSPGYDITHDTNMHQGKVYLYLGSSNISSDLQASITFVSNYHAYVGLSTEIVQDLNGDNIDDIMISSQGYVFVFYGGNLLDLKCREYPCQLFLEQADQFVFKSNFWGTIKKSIFQGVHHGKNYTLLIEPLRDRNSFTDNGVFCLYSETMYLQKCSSLDNAEWQLGSGLIGIHNLLNYNTKSIAVKTHLPLTGENRYAFVSLPDLEILQVENNMLSGASLLSNVFDIDANGMFDVLFILNNHLFLQKTFQNSFEHLELLELQGLRNMSIIALGVKVGLVFFLLCSPEKEHFSGICWLYALDREGRIRELFTLQGSAGSHFGYNLYQIGDINGKGVVDVLISAPYETNKFLQGGSAYILLIEEILFSFLEEEFVITPLLFRLIGEGNNDFFALVTSAFN